MFFTMTIGTNKLKICQIIVFPISIFVMNLQYPMFVIIASLTLFSPNLQ
jgi:hypothetical protein